MLRGKNFDKLVAAGVTVLTGTAEFVDHHHLKVCLTNGSVQELEAEQIFINTGARPIVPPIPGLKDSKYALVSEQLLDQRQLPKHLAIIGGGYIGVEMASMYANFGSQVTIIQDGAAFLPREDEEVAAVVLESLQKRGIRIISSAKIEQVEDAEDTAVLTIALPQEKIQLQADLILVATGRKPNVEDLHLERTDIALTDRGAIQTDSYLQTTVPGIYAMGDVVGGLQFTYISLDDCRIVKSQILGDGSRHLGNRGEVPYSVFIDPPFSRVGMTEKEATEKGHKVQIFWMPAAAIPKAQVLRKPEGMLKAVVDEETKELLGAHLFCEESHELINLMKLVIDAKLPYTVLRDNIYTHPTMSEALNDLFA